MSKTTGWLAAAVAGIGALILLILVPVLLLAGSAGSATLDDAGVPEEYRAFVQEASTRCDEVTGPILAAQIEAESNWNPDARSPAGALGISQFMPGTWETWGKDYDGDGVADPLNPADAIGSQADFMCALASDIAVQLEAGDVSGDPLELTLAAYNAGPGAVLQYGGIPPYAETAGYVSKITDLADSKYTAADPAAATIVDGVALPVDLPASGSYGNTGENWSSYHTGEDFSGPCGTPVRAAHGGTIETDSTQAWAGPYLVRVVTGPGELATWYAHMESAVVQDGQSVQPGEVIGHVGTLGNSTGCHLHFEVHPRGGGYAQDDVDPQQWLIEQGLNP